MPSYHIEMLSYRYVGWTCIAVGVAGSFAAAMSSQFAPAVGILSIAALGIYIAVYAGSYDIDGATLSHRCVFGVWRIRWDEVEALEIGEVDGTLVLSGNGKRFILSPPSWWGGSAKSDALRFLLEQIQQRNLTPKLSRTAAYKIMKSTRVKDRTV